MNDEPTEERWQRPPPLLPPRRPSRGRPVKDHSTVANVILPICQFADWFGWRRTVTFVGGLGSAIATLLFYFVPLAVGPIYWVAIAVGALYSVLLSGYVCLTAIVPSQASPKDRGNATAIYCLGAGLAVFVGPATYTILNPFIDNAGVIIVYAGLHVVSAIPTWVFGRTEEDPAEQKDQAANEARAVHT